MTSKNTIWEVTQDKKDQIYIYTCSTLSIIVLSFARSLIYSILCWRSSKIIHNSAFNALINTSLAFFQNNPSGRILNRLSKDLQSIDEYMPRILFESIQIIFLVTTAFIITCIVNPYFVVPSVVIILISFWMAKIFLNIILSILQLEGTSKLSLQCLHISHLR